MKREIDRLIFHEGGDKFQAMFIEVDRNDGMTWAAQSIHDMIQQTYSQFAKRVIAVKGYDHLEEAPLVDIIGNKRFYKALKTLNPENNRQRYFLLIFAGLMLIKLFSDIQISLSSNETANILEVILHRPTTMIMIFLNVLFTLFLHRISEQLSGGSGDEKVVTKLKEQSRQDIALQN